MKNKITYDSLLQDDRFLSDAYYALQGLGETATKDRKEVLDKFLQKRRYFDTNISSVRPVYPRTPLNGARMFPLFNLINISPFLTTIQ